MFNPSIQNPQRLQNLTLAEYPRRSEYTVNDYSDRRVLTGSVKIPMYQSYNQIDYDKISFKDSNTHKQDCLNNFNLSNINPSEESHIQTYQQIKKPVEEIVKRDQIDPEHHVKAKTEKEIKPIYTSPNAYQNNRLNIRTANESKKMVELEKPLKETFNQSSLPDTDSLYQSMLRSYSVAICDYLNRNPKYKYWSKNWQILEKNLKKNDIKMGRLSSDDKEIAYTENKGELLKFRWRDKLTYLPRSVFCYVLLHELTHQVFPPSFIGHRSPFPEMLCLLCVAGYELRLFDLKNIPTEMVKSNDQPITSRHSIAEEILYGIQMLREKNPESSTYYDQLEKCVKSDLRS